MPWPSPRQFESLNGCLLQMGDLDDLVQEVEVVVLLVVASAPTNASETLGADDERLFFGKAQMKW